MKTYSIEYDHKGKRWSVDLMAEDFDDAKARAEAIGKGEVLELVEEVEVAGFDEINVGGKA